MSLNNNSKTFLIVGLGNPGNAYTDTRHNIGFNLVDQIKDFLGFPDFSNKFDSLFSSKQVNNTKVFLLKPQTYMNLSGEALSKIVNFYKIDLDNILVIHDDLDLQLGKVKIKQGGGSGGHNGIKSIDKYIGPNYFRLRIGIGKPEAFMEVSNFVLSKFSATEVNIINRILKRIIENFDLIIEKNFSSLTNNLAMESNKDGI